MTSASAVARSPMVLVDEESLAALGDENVLQKQEGDFAGGYLVRVAPDAFEVLTQREYLYGLRDAVPYDEDAASGAGPGLDMMRATLEYGASGSAAEIARELSAWLRLSPPFPGAQIKGYQSQFQKAKQSLKPTVSSRAKGFGAASTVNPDGYYCELVEVSSGDEIAQQLQVRRRSRGASTDAPTVLDHVRNASELAKDVMRSGADPRVFIAALDLEAEPGPEVPRGLFAAARIPKCTPIGIYGGVLQYALDFKGQEQGVLTHSEYQVGYTVLPGVLWPNFYTMPFPLQTMPDGSPVPHVVVNAAAAASELAFANHASRESGLGNLEFTSVYDGHRLYLMAFTIKDVEAGGQLLWDYGEEFWRHSSIQPSLDYASASATPFEY